MSVFKCRLVSLQTSCREHCLIFANSIGWKSNRAFSEIPGRDSGNVGVPLQPAVFLKIKWVVVNAEGNVGGEGPHLPQTCNLRHVFASDI